MSTRADERPFGWMIRPSGPEDLPFLCEMLYEAIYWHPAMPRQPLSVTLTEPDIARYLFEWGRGGDAALIAVDASSRPIGAAWYRLFTPEEPGYGFLSESIPELSLGVAPAYRRLGIGRCLVCALLDHARNAGFSAVSLSAAADNPAIRLYTRCGFVKVGENGGSWTMRADLHSDESKKPRGAPRGR